MALKSGITRSSIKTEINELLHRANIAKIGVELYWVPEHVNIAGNEKADA